MELAYAKRQNWQEKKTPFKGQISFFAVRNLKYKVENPRFGVGFLYIVLFVLHQTCLVTAQLASVFCIQTCLVTIRFGQFWRKTKAHRIVNTDQTKLNVSFAIVQ